MLTVIPSKYIGSASKGQMSQQYSIVSGIKRFIFLLMNNLCPFVVFCVLCCVFAACHWSVSVHLSRTVEDKSCYVETDYCPRIIHYPLCICVCVEHMPCASSHCSNLQQSKYTY